MLKSLTDALGITAVKMYVIIITRGTWMLTLGTARLQRRQVVEKKVSLLAGFLCCLVAFSDVSLPELSVAVLLH